MKTPRQLQDMNVFADGRPLSGQCQSFTRPKIVVKTEDYLGAGLGATVKLSMGSLEGLEATHKYGGEIPELNAGIGEARLDASQLRFVGAYLNEENGRYDAVEIIIRGRHSEGDHGDDEVGSKSGSTYKTDCVYYKQSRNGVVEFEIDVLNKVFIVNGRDRWAELRRITR